MRSQFLRFSKLFVAYFAVCSKGNDRQCLVMEWVPGWHDITMRKWHGLFQSEVEQFTLW